MDPYSDVIPDDHGEEIRERVRKRDGSDGSDNEERPPKRPRTNTDLPLPQESGSNNQEIQEPPKPEADLSKYTLERLQQGLKYINYAAKRKITPRTKQFLILHEDAYKVAIEGKAPKDASRAVVQAMDRVYHSSAFFLRPRDTEEHERLMCFVQLRRLELLANYGDYLGQELQQFRADLKGAASSASEDVRETALELGSSKTWVEIADMDDLRKHAHIACGVLGIDPNHTIWLIKEWAERNHIFHNHIRQYISDCHWARLAKQVCRDLKELFNVAPDEDTARNYEKALLSIRDQYFKVLDREDPEFWYPNECAVKLAEEKVAREKKREKRAKE